MVLDDVKLLHDEEVEPTDRTVEDGSVTLQGEPSDKARTGTWRTSAFIYVLACGNSAALMAIQGNFFSYIVDCLHFDNASAATINSNLAGTALLVPILTGFLADAYFGAFWVIVGACVVYSAGMIILILSVALPSLVPPPCDQSPCQPASELIIRVFQAGVLITCAATTGINPTVLSLGQQQFDQTDPVEKQNGRLFFSIFYAVYNASFFLGSTIFIWIQTDIGYKEGYSIVAFFFLLCAIVFFSGTPLLRHQRPAGSPLTTLAQVIVAAIRNRRKVLPSDPSELFEINGETSKLSIGRIRKTEHTDRFRFLDKAAVIPHESLGYPGIDQQVKGTWNNWKVCSVTQVEVLKTVMQMIPLWFFSGMTYLMSAQEFTFFVRQASTMDRSLGPNFAIPPATMTCLSMIGALVFIGFYETFLVPVLVKRTGHPRGLSPLARIGLASFLAFFVMVTAALVEIWRVRTIQDNNLTDLQLKEGQLPMSAFWLTPQLVLSGVFNPLMGTAQLEFLYQESPETMVSLAMALAFGSQAIGKFISSAIVDYVKHHTGDGPGNSWLTSEFNSGGLTKFFLLLAIVLAINFVTFIIAAKFYSHKRLKDHRRLSSKNKLIERSRVQTG